MNCTLPSFTPEFSKLLVLELPQTESSLELKIAEIKKEVLNCLQRLPAEQRANYFQSITLQLQLIHNTISKMQKAALSIFELKKYLDTALLDVQSTSTRFFKSTETYERKKSSIFNVFTDIEESCSLKEALPLTSNGTPSNSYKFLEKPVHLKPNETLLIRISEQKLPVLQDGSPKGEAHIFSLEKISDKKTMQVCVEKNSSCKPIPLSKKFSENLVDILNKIHPEGRCCFYFVNEMHHANVSNYVCNPERDKWHSIPLKEKECLAPEEPIALIKDGVPIHYAIHLSQGFFLSVYGNNRPLVISTLENLQITYPSDAVHRLKLKLP